MTRLTIIILSKQIRLTDALKKITDFFLVETTSLNFDDVRSGMASFSQAAAGILYGFSVVLEKATRGATTMDGQNANLVCDIIFLFR